jgi:hypothetical protein
MGLEELKRKKAELDRAYAGYLKSEPGAVGEAHHSYKRLRIEYMTACAEYVENQVALSKVM